MWGWRGKLCAYNKDTCVKVTCYDMSVLVGDCLVYPVAQKFEKGVMFSFSYWGVHCRDPDGGGLLDAFSVDRDCNNPPC